VVAPVVLHGRAWGELYVARRVGEPAFARADADFASVLAALIASGVAQTERFAEVQRLAFTDPLTGLGNRRMLMRDLRVKLKAASMAHPLMLMLFDLNGFKTYNDAYGHGAGDDLLSRLGRALASAVMGRGWAYRLGGDEFCVLAPLGQDGVEPTVAAASSALTEHGTGFTIDASYGLILLPSESEDVAEALRLVDQRMYAQKRSGGRSADRQSKDVLLHALHERNPELRSLLQEVGELVGLVAERMGLPAEDSQLAVQAGELRDIGQVAIPDAILGKDGELDDEERAFLRNQPLISERIISAAPALTPIARLVRATHEHFDGSGYPDGLAGEDIPLGSRIVAACHRYVLLTAARRGDPQVVADALEALRRDA
jgi:two-component system, cell cycle response regulator